LVNQFVYESLANKLREKIIDNEWGEGDKLPSIRALCVEYQVSKVTVQSALHKLEAIGLVSARPRSGYYVLAQTTYEDTHSLSKLAVPTVKKPQLVNVPDIFHEIMQRSAAFDILPSATPSPVSSHIQLLNRHVTRATRNNAKRNTHYYGNPYGAETLRQQIAKHYKSRKLQVSSNDICITSGCQNSLYLALSVSCEPGDIVAIESPAFYGVLQLIQSLKLKVVEIPASFTQGVKPNDVLSVLKECRIKACVVTPNFSTPTGSCMTLEDKKALYELSVEHDFTLIEDDIYGDLGFHFTPEPIKSFDKTGHVILCSSMSKALSRDLRIGWIMGGKHHTNIMRNKLVHQLSGSQSIQEGIASYMAEGEYRRHLLHYRDTLKNQRDQLIETINTHWTFPFRYTVPDGGLTLWLELDKSINTVELYSQALAKNITLTPGRLFSSSDNFQHFLRLSFVHPIENQRLAAFKWVNKLVS